MRSFQSTVVPAGGVPAAGPLAGAATVAPAKPKISAAEAQRTKAPRATHRNATELTSPPNPRADMRVVWSTSRPYGRSSHLEIGTSRFAQAFARVAFHIDLLADEGPLLDEPYTRQLDGPLRELRFHLDRDAMGDLLDARASGRR